ncbi:MAG: hypothetical protein WAM14_16755 [Candidatus Nitrosopolaris sp.]
MLPSHCRCSSIVKGINNFSYDSYLKSYVKRVLNPPLSTYGDSQLFLYMLRHLISVDQNPRWFDVKKRRKAIGISRRGVSVLINARILIDANI